MYQVHLKSLNKRRPPELRQISRSSFSHLNIRISIKLLPSPSDIWLCMLKPHIIIFFVSYSIFAMKNMSFLAHLLQMSKSLSNYELSAVCCRPA